MSCINSISKKNEKNILLNLFHISDSDDDEIISLESIDSDLANINSGGGSDVLTLENNIYDSDSNELLFESQMNKISIKLKQNKLQGIASQLWPAAVYLCNFFESNFNIIINTSDYVDVIELGAGIGLCGIFLSKCFSNVRNVYLTDLNIAMPLLNDNITLNNIESARAVPLEWGNDESYENFISSIPSIRDCKNKPLLIAADCIYWECIFIPFLTTIRQFISIGCNIILCNVKRFKRENKFFNLCKKYKIKYEIINEHVEMITDSITLIEKKRIIRIYKLS